MIRMFKILAADVPTPPADRVTIFVEDSTGEPSYKDETGTAASLIGPPGEGVPTGGTAGQVLEKIDGIDHNTQWATPASAPTGVTIVTEASTSTMTPATHAGLAKYVRAADDVTFNTSQSYTAGEVYNIRATAALTLIGTGVTLTVPNGGTLDMDADMAVTVIMTSSAAGDVIGQTVPV